MVYVKETPFNEVGKPIMIVLLAYMGLVAINILAAIISRSPNLYFILSAILFILTTPTAATISIKRGMSGKKASSIILLTTIIIIVLGLIVFIYASYLLWIALTVRPLIRSFDIALIVPIITIITAYFLSEYLEKKIPEIYWRLSRAVSDRVRGALSASATGIIGPSIAFFGLLNFDAYFAFLPLIYALIELKRSVNELRATSKQKKNLNAFNEHLQKVLGTIPNIVKVYDTKFDPANQFLIVYARFSVSSFLNEEVVEKIADYVKIYVLENFGIVSYYRIEADKEKADKVKVALPIIGENELSDNFDSSKYLIVVLNTNGDELSREVIELGNSEDRMSGVERARELVKKGVMIVALNNIDVKAKRELRGWFTEIVNVQTKSVDEALKKIREII